MKLVKFEISNDLRLLWFLQSESYENVMKSNSSCKNEKLEY